MNKIISLIIIAMIFTCFSCKKKNTIEEIQTPNYDNITGTKIRYVLAITGAENSVGKSESFSIKNAKVSLLVNNSILTKGVDEKGMVYFDNLFAGNTIVKVECDGYTTANLIVDLSISDSTVHDSENLRVVSTIITLFPVKGDNAATIYGKLLADLDLTNSGNETVMETLSIRATVCSENLNKYINHNVSGGITNLYYENASVVTKSSSGNYSLQVPAALNGLKILIEADNFAYHQKISDYNQEYKIFSKNTDTVTVFPGSRIIKNLEFIP